MTNTPVNPPGTPASLAYSQGVLSEGSKVLHISGQVGVGPDGKAGNGIAEQCRFAWANLAAALKAGGMEIGDLVKITSFLTKAGDIAAYRETRGAALGSHKPASTLIVVSALADPGWLVEIEGVAIR
ncbi:MAG: RidA family protein [Pseudolabrys sp.]|nr:RidA family protein [Pseudolabrys sp.]MCW5684967.1 RidA family protein [Pseudolabrys sp.]